MNIAWWHRFSAPTDQGQGGHARHPGPPQGWAAHVRDGRVFHEPLPDLPDRLPEANAQVEERIYDPVMHVDHDIAVIWCGYDVYFDGQPSHWGTNIVSLMKEDGQWRACGIMDNGRSGPRPVPAKSLPDSLLGEARRRRELRTLKRCRQLVNLPKVS